MKIIHKQVAETPQGVITVPNGSKIIQFGYQEGDIVVWYEFDTDYAGDQRLPYNCVNTGMTFNGILEYVNTVSNSDDIVWHCYA